MLTSFLENRRLKRDAGVLSRSAIFDSWTELPVCAATNGSWTDA